jgi:hypothetical protein
MAEHKWQPSLSGRGHSVTTPEGHTFTVLHHEDGTHSVHIQPKGGKSYPAQTPGSRKTGASHASFPSHEEAIGEAVKHYHTMTGGTARASSLARSFTGLMFFQAEVNNFPNSLKKALSDEPMSFKGGFGHAVSSDGFDAKGHYDFDFRSKQVFYVENNHASLIGSVVKGGSKEMNEVAMAHHSKKVDHITKEMLKSFIDEAVEMYKAVGAAHMEFGSESPKRSVSVMNPTLHSTSDFGEYHVHAHSPGKSVVSFKPHGGGGSVEHIAGQNEHGIPHPIKNESVPGMIAGHHLGKRMAHTVSSLASSPKSGFKEQKVGQKIAASMPIGRDAVIKAARIVTKAFIQQGGALKKSQGKRRFARM